jgi:hypothetical protein
MGKYGNAYADFAEAARLCPNDQEAAQAIDDIRKKINL